MSLSEEFKQCRIVDLSKVLEPGKATGPIDTGKRRLEVRKFSYPPGETMHEIDMETHIGTHIEAPCHYVDVRYGRTGMDIGQIPLEKLFGDAILVDLKDFGVSAPLTPAYLEKIGVREDDIVLIGNARQSGRERPYIAKEAAQWLAERRVKLVGIDDSVYPEEPQYLLTGLERYYTHDHLLSNDIPLIEGLANLDKLTAERFFFIGFVVPIRQIEAFPIRAVAFERRG